MEINDRGSWTYSGLACDLCFHDPLQPKCHSLGNNQHSCFGLSSGCQRHGLLLVNGTQGQRQFRALWLQWESKRSLRRRGRWRRWKQNISQRRPRRERCHQEAVCPGHLQVISKPLVLLKPGVFDTDDPSYEGEIMAAKESLSASSRRVTRGEKHVQSKLIGVWF